jgi:hypothetical protein
VVVDRGSLGGELFVMSEQMKWIFVRCRLRCNRPTFTTDDMQIVIKEMQRFADSKQITKKRRPIGPLEYRLLGDRLMFYWYNRYGMRGEFACLKLVL